MWSEFSQLWNVCCAGCLNLHPRRCRRRLPVRQYSIILQLQIASLQESTFVAHLEFISVGENAKKTYQKFLSKRANFGAEKLHLGKIWGH